ncbi:PHB depolymerase family esterase [Sphingomonas sp. HDW15A]|uniref:extracellular catalytic domain type 1 short-chain-length polyhydroxyalkanoate depolymerase n=1 Tax=Sphingomonas sp. HDW15A TaxID=2714942 RepID=UPI001F10B3F3|nr:PHB depolymerase family esterase [Sphingomonas sp. HDW15A]
MARLTSVRRTMEAANANDDGRLAVLTDFGVNPGNLDALFYAPAESPRALVVVLHGCTQSASVYDKGSGWSKLAEKEGFAVLFPQQRRSNNPNLCFNWYQPGDARRGRGEAASISQMIEYLAAKYGLDRSGVFITGLSAGGAMTSVMLASYPELFAGGAIIAGLPFASANSLPEALERMRGHGFPSGPELCRRAKAAADTRVEPPTLSVWHGTNDNIVDPINATAIVKQWRDLHGCGEITGRVETVAGHRRETWSDSNGRTIIERYDVRGMGHGTPLDTRGHDACGTTGPHMLQANICSTRKIASSWGLVGELVWGSAPARRHLDPTQEPRTSSSNSAPHGNFGALELS